MVFPSTRSPSVVELTNFKVTLPDCTASCQTLDTEQYQEDIGFLFSKLVNRLFKWQGTNLKLEVLERLAKDVTELASLYQRNRNLPIAEWTEFVSLVKVLAGSLTENGKALFSISIEQSEPGETKNPYIIPKADLRLGNGSLLRFKPEGLELSLIGGDELLQGNLVLMQKL